MLDAAVRIGVSGALGAGSALLLSMNPATGGVFGVVGRLINEVTGPIFDYLFHLRPEVRLLIDVGRFVVLTSLTTVACTVLGFPIAFSTALLLQITQLALAYLGRYICELGRLWILADFFTPAFALTPTSPWDMFNDHGAMIR